MCLFLVEVAVVVESVTVLHRMVVVVSVVNHNVMEVAPSSTTTESVASTESVSAKSESVSAKSESVAEKSTAKNHTNQLFIFLVYSSIC